MSTPVAHTTEQAGWLLDHFVAQVPGVVHAATVAADGLCIARSASLSVDLADPLAAMTAGMASLTGGAASHFGAEPVIQTVIEMSGLYLCLMSVSDGSHLVVLAAGDADLGKVAFEMVRLVERVGESAFTPTLRDGRTSDAAL